MATSTTIASTTTTSTTTHHGTHDTTSVSIIKKNTTPDSTHLLPTRETPLFWGFYFFISTPLTPPSHPLRGGGFIMYMLSYKNIKIYFAAHFEHFFYIRNLLSKGLNTINYEV